MARIWYVLLILFFIVGCSANSKKTTEDINQESDEINYEIYMDILKNEVKRDLKLTSSRNLVGYSAYMYDELEYDEESFNKIYDDGENGDVMPVAFVNHSEGVLVRKKHSGDNQVYNISLDSKKNKWIIEKSKFLESDLVITEEYLMKLYYKEVNES